MMTPDALSALIGTRFGQVAWVVQDIKATERFFREEMGVPRFWKAENLRAQDVEGTYHGRPGDFEFHLYMTYAGGILLELIQPVSGSSIWKDFLDEHGRSGVQHIAYTVPEAEFEQATAHMTESGYAEIQALRFPPARVAYFDTYAEIGVATEIIGVTEAGWGLVEQIKNGTF